MESSAVDEDFSMESLFRLLLDEGNECIWAVDNVYALLYGNRKYHRFIASHFRDKNSPSTTLTEIPDKEKAAFWKKAYDRVITGVECQFDYALGSGDDEESYQVKMQPIYQGKMIMGIAAEGKDITEKIRTVEQLTDSQEKIRQMEKNQTVIHLAGDIARDFNNRLLGISGYVELLLREIPESNETKEYARKIMEGVDGSSDLVTRLLSFAQKGSHNPVSMDLHRLMDEGLEILRPVLERKIKLQITKGAKYPRIRGDKISILNSFINLVLNARDALPQGGTIALTTENTRVTGPWAKTHAPHLKPGLYLKLSVKDNGCGMDEEIKQKIFEPFFSSNKHPGGTGIGLLTVFKAVKKHQGAILVQSTPRKGSLFQLYFPCLAETKK